jgi:hypothetical protein
MMLGCGLNPVGVFGVPGFRMSRAACRATRLSGGSDEAVANPRAGRDHRPASARPVIGEGVMALTSTEPVVVHAIDDLLRILEMVRHEQHRDPLRAAEDMLLEMRHEVVEQERATVG